ncbi:putative RNA helicase SDE3 isoform X2 [Apium graveolens]|uniref:putative RNA helicase SDE3 isoform X2 n=1 Tax=Apium graveolens TaxID=4045 RepID=UPI003D7AFB75
MLSFLRCVLCCDDEINTGHSSSQLYYDESPSQYNYDTFSRTTLPNSFPSTQTRSQEDFCSVYRFPPKSDTPSVYNPPKRTLPRISVNVNSRVNPKKPPDVTTATRTNVFPKSTSSSSYSPLTPSPSPKLGSSFSSTSSSPFSKVPGSPKSSPVSMKPILARAASTLTSNQTKSQYRVVEQGSTPLYVIPEDIKDLIRKEIVPGILKKPLSPQTYKDYFVTLLYAEDYYLEGIIFRVVRSNIVLVEFGDDFHAQHYSSCKYDVKFSFNRVCLKRAHQAISASSDMLFKNFLLPDYRPKDSYFSEKVSFTEKILFSSHKLDSAAISRIINLNGSPAYLLEGPLSVTREKQLSRTGMVLRDAVVHLSQASLHNRILICAPTNSTCDVFLRNLRKEVGDSNIFRANAAFRELDGVPIDILPFCPYKENEEVFSCPTLSQLLKFKVILSTFMSSFRLHNEGIEGGHFTHIFLIDASSAIEPEILVPLTNLTSVSTKVVVTGAPRNQSSWVRSNIARQNGLRTSYFERLRESKLYRDLNPESITQLKDDSSSSSSKFK